jgi:RNA polymerase-binding protein DksA
MSIDTEHFRTLLTEERERVQQAVNHLHQDHSESIEGETEELATAADNHPADMAGPTLDREIDYALGENSELVLNEIDAALKRIDDGTYGKCTECGKEIGLERLEARPWAALCIDDARNAELRP